MESTVAGASHAARLTLADFRLEKPAEPESIAVSRSRIRDCRANTVRLGAFCDCSDGIEADGSPEAFFTTLLAKPFFREMKTSLRFLLLGTFAGSAAMAQQPPANSPHPPGIQKMIDAPAWYLNYTVTLEASGSDGSSPGTHSLRRVTSGRATLGVRSGGPSLSTIANPTLMVITAPDQLDRLIANYANWLSGPQAEDENLPPAQRMTEAQADALWARVRQQNIEAHEQFSYDYTGPSSAGGTDRTQQRGSGTVWHVGEPLEIDAANRKFRILFSAGFTDGPTTINARTITKETSIGTIHYNRQVMKTGLYPGEVIGSITPAIGTPAAPFFEGTLPNGGNISFSSNHAIQLGPGLARGLRGTFSIAFTLSPDPPVPIELIIEPPTDYVRWMPLGNKDEKTAGDGIPIKVVLQKIGGGTPQFKAARITYNLWKTSREKGICMNWPPNPEPTPPFDLQFEQRENPNLLVVGTDGQSAVNSAPNGYTDTVTVSSFDFGAHGEFAAMAELENGQTVHGVVKFTTNQQQLKLPFRDEPSIIATQFFSIHGLTGVGDNDDAERDPVGDGFTGDGLTLYEEYRGFMVGDNWTPGDPKKKDVFVVNELRGLPATGIGIHLFAGVTKFKVHHLLWDNQVDANGQINYLRTTGPQIVEQHAIRIQAGDLVLLGNNAARVTGKVGTPGTAKTVSIQPDLGRSSTLMYMASTLAHEMLHACNVFHHGECDADVWWSYNPGSNQIYESDVAYDATTGSPVSAGNRVPITVTTEAGVVVDPALFFRSGITGGPIVLALAHGQHSGDDACIMRYDNANAYKSRADVFGRYLSGRETTGFALCTSPAGTGVNDANRTTPQPRYFTAATSQNGGPGVLLPRGNCVHQLRINDLATEPER
jgi:hypothetical protein